MRHSSWPCGLVSMDIESVRRAGARKKLGIRPALATARKKAIQLLVELKRTGEIADAARHQGHRTADHHHRIAAAADVVHPEHRPVAEFRRGHGQQPVPRAIYRRGIGLYS